MTVKAGQKCTAIRRALVPEPLLDAVAEATSARLAKVVIGNPADESVRMGALASLDQREEVRRSVKALLSAGMAVFGGAGLQHEIQTQLAEHVYSLHRTLLKMTYARSCISMRVSVAERRSARSVTSSQPLTVGGRNHS
jgi:acyl-CoA reductase-like NAD-dependent aldehyde dehydrogenase